MNHSPLTPLAPTRSPAEAAAALERADPQPRPAGARLVRAWLLTGVLDGTFASVQSLTYGSNPVRLFQGVASTLLGPSAMEGGIRTAAIGLLMHFGVAFAWSAVFLAVYERSASVRRIAGARRGALKVAVVYGPLIWLVMSLAVIPLLTHKPPNITVRWWTQLVGHVVFVGLPIVAMIRTRRAPGALG
jgi:hypothetical protein